jgi:hypothetical protein
MSNYRDITSECEIEAIAGRTGWVTPGTRDAAGVISYRHSRLPVQLVVRSYFGPEKRRDFYVISFSDPEYLAFFTQDAGWADFGASMGGGSLNTGSGRTLTVPEPKTKDFMHLLVQLTKGTA